MSEHDASTPDTDPCQSCRALTRRGFITVSTCTVTALLVGLRPSEAAEAIAGTLTYPIPGADGTTIDREAQVILVREQQNVYAFNLSCPHQNAAVRWNAGGQRFQCSRHDSKYLPNGTYTSGRATRNMDRFPIRRAGANVVVDTSGIIRSDQNPSGWTAAVARIE
jgi:nitrite reductase/ring-hydroxylating ferredoxin subunit